MIRTYFIARLFVLVCGLLGMQNVLADAAGTLFLVVGDVNITRANGSKLVGSKGMELFEGDQIQTADNGLAQISLSDGGRLSLRSGSEIVFTQYKYHKEDAGSGGFILSLLRGGFRSITGLIAKNNPDAYKIQTSTATIGVRGTDHEPFFIPEPKIGEPPPVAPPGTYDKVNSGQTFMHTKLGQIDIKPGEAGHAPVRLEQAPRILPKVPDFYGEPPIKGGRLLPMLGRGGEDEKGKPEGEGDEKGTARTLPPGRPGGPTVRPGSTPTLIAPDARQGSTEPVKPMAGPTGTLPPKVIESIRTIGPVKTMELLKTMEPTKSPEPTKAPEPTRMIK